MSGDNAPSGADVPSSVDFHDPAQARAWVDETVRKRPWRPQFFAAFVSALKARFDRPFTVLELGSGPGYLAEAILANCPVSHYAALDFSDAMHALAAERLSVFGAVVEYVRRDFRATNWADDLPRYGAVVTMQAAHEVRHTRHLAPLLERARTRLVANGWLLYCDHYAEPRTAKNPALYVGRDEQATVLVRAGFSAPERLLDAGGMALYAARNPG